MTDVTRGGVKCALGSCTENFQICNINYSNCYRKSTNKKEPKLN